MNSIYGQIKLPFQGGREQDVFFSKALPLVELNCPFRAEENRTVSFPRRCLWLN